MHSPGQDPARNSVWRVRRTLDLDRYSVRIFLLEKRVILSKIHSPLLAFLWRLFVAGGGQKRAE